MCVFSFPLLFCPHMSFPLVGKEEEKSKKNFPSSSDTVFRVSTSEWVHSHLKLTLTSLLSLEVEMPKQIFLPSPSLFGN